MATLAGMFGGGATETFLGLPRRGEAGAEAPAVVLLGAGAGTPYPSVGAYCAGGPAAIRAAAAAYSGTRSHWNWDLGGPLLPPGVVAADAGDLPTRADDPEGNRARIAAAVGGILAEGAVPLLLGGDDSVQIPMLEAYGAQGRRIHILQIDAHIDWRDEVEGVRLGLSSTMRRASEMAHVGRIVQAGARGTGSARPGDVADARAAEVAFVPAQALHRGGIGEAVALIPEGEDVVLCIDLDALDPSVMPAVIGRTPGGLSYGQLLELIAQTAARARIAGVGVVEFMPERDVDGLGATVAQALVTAVIGILARQAAGRRG